MEEGPEKQCFLKLDTEISNIMYSNLSIHIWNIFRYNKWCTKARLCMHIFGYMLVYIPLDELWDNTSQQLCLQKTQIHPQNVVVQQYKETWQCTEIVNPLSKLLLEWWYFFLRWTTIRFVDSIVLKVYSRP